MVRAVMRSHSDAYEMSDTRFTKGIRAVDDGRTFEWNGRAWVDVATFLRAPAEVAGRLRKLAAPELRAADDAITDFDGLLSAATSAKAVRDLARAERLITRALELRPSHEGALCVLSSLRREQGDPQRALSETAEVGSRSRYAPLLTTRAAALCDLQRWEDAKQLMGVVLGIGNPSPEAWKVVERIKAARPELYARPD